MLRFIGQFLAWAFLYALIALFLWGVSTKIQANHDTATDVSKLVPLGRHECPINKKGEPMFEEETAVDSTVHCFIGFNPAEEGYVYVFLEDANFFATSLWKFNANKRTRERIWFRGQITT